MKIISNTLVLLATILPFTTSAANDGIVVRYILSVETMLSDGTVKSRSYENAILFAYGETVEIALPGRWSAQLTASGGGESVELGLRLNSGSPDEPDIKRSSGFGKPVEISWQIDAATVYRATLTPSKGTLPSQTVGKHRMSL